MKKAYKRIDKHTYYIVVSDNLVVVVWPYIKHISPAGIHILNGQECTECELSEAVAAFDKVVKSLKDKMI